MIASVPCARRSAPLATIAPTTDTVSPAHVMRGSRLCWNTVAMRACQTGCVATSAVAMATLVI